MNKKSIYALAAGIALSVTLPSCQSDKDTPTGSTPESSGVALQVNSSSIFGGDTRSGIVEGESLPDNCDYVLFALDRDTVNYIYTGEYALVHHMHDRDSVIYPSEGIMLPSLNVPATILAFYPEGYTDHVDYACLNTLDREDFMWGTAVDRDGQPMYASEENPAVNILFEHILARITLKIKRGENNQDSYKFTDFTLGGDYENSYRTAYANLRQRTISNHDYEDLKPIPGIWEKYYFNEDQNDVVTVDFLVIPSNTTWVLDMTYDFSDYHLVANLPQTNYESGNQYIFNVTIDKEVDNTPYLRISDVKVTPWVRESAGSLDVIVP